MADKGGWREFEREGGQRPECTARPAAAGTPRAQRRVRVQRTRAGKGGKLVTAITGLEIAEAEARELLKTLKNRCGTGGTVKEGVIELQGDQVAAALAALEAAGFRPKQAGG
jgi:translation initiation factor 1